MTLDQLRCLCAIAETGGFRLASERMRRSQPAVSQQIKALERELGHSLVERRAGTLTPVGQRMYERARHILVEAESLVREMDDFGEGQGRVLRVGTSDTTALYALPPVMSAFSKRMPEARLMLVNRSSDAIAEHVARGDLDLGIVTLPVAQKVLEQRPLFEQALVLVTPQNHPLATQSATTLDALRHEPMLLLDAATRTGSLLRSYFQEAGFTPQVVLDTGSFEVIKRYVAEGIGVSFLPRAVVTSADTALAVVQVADVPSVRIGAVWRSEAYQTRVERTFLQIAEEMLQPMQ